MSRNGHQFLLNVRIYYIKIIYFYRENILFVWYFAIIMGNVRAVLLKTKRVCVHQFPNEREIEFLLIKL